MNVVGLSVVGIGVVVVGLAVVVVTVGGGWVVEGRCGVWNVEGL